MTRKRILVVEDDASVRGACVDILGTQGYTMIGVDDGASALAEIARTPPDVILLDLLMPRAKIDGLSFLSEVARSAAARTPIVILSAFGDVLAQELSAWTTGELHIAAVLAKPFELETLVYEVDRALGLGTSA